MVHASEQERADVQIKRKLRPQTLARIKPENLVFLDEIGINTDMTCRYGRSKGKISADENYEPGNFYLRLSHLPLLLLLLPIAEDGLHSADTEDIY